MISKSAAQGVGVGLKINRRQWSCPDVCIPKLYAVCVHRSVKYGEKFTKLATKKQLNRNEKRDESMNEMRLLKSLLLFEKKKKQLCM